MQRRQAMVRYFALEESTRDHADDLAALRQRRIGDYAHQATTRTAVDEDQATPRQLASECLGGEDILRARARTRPCKHADAPHISLFHSGAPCNRSSRLWRGAPGLQA